MDSIVRFRIAWIVNVILLVPATKLFSVPVPDTNITIYQFPGQGSDCRIFSKLNLDNEYRIVNIKYSVPERNASMSSYAVSLIDQIDTTSTYIFIGVSLGGMISTELTEVLDPALTIIISSAKTRSELPFCYRMLKYLPVYKIIPAPFFKLGAFVAQPVFEPDRKPEKDTFIKMLKGKNPLFLKRSIGMIVSWNQSTVGENIIHIHGTNDHTIPGRRIKADYLIQDGSHMMALTRAEEVNRIIKSVLISMKE